MKDTKNKSSFKTSIMNYISFAGRMSRYNYIINCLCLVGGTIICWGIIWFLDTSWAVKAFSLIGVYIVGRLLYLPLFVKRSHDLGYSAWFLLLLLTGIGDVVSLLMFFWVGNKGNNKYGPDPLEKLKTKN